VATLLGDNQIVYDEFGSIDHIFESLQSEEYLALNAYEKQLKVGETLHELIESYNAPCFLLGPLLQFISRVCKEGVFKNYTFSHFELWLNQYSGLTDQQNLHIRGKIMGRFIPRSEYQISFPIGMNKTYEGSHYVTAHGSPDLDTIIASFWGWVDAFSARVSKGLHILNIPGGPSESQVEIPLLFYEVFGSEVFEYASKFRTELSLTSMEMMTQEGLSKRRPFERFFELEQPRELSANILTDEDGFYLGDWRHIDVEGVRQVINSFNIALRWLENHLHISLISLFSRSGLSKSDLERTLVEAFAIKFAASDPAQEFTQHQNASLEAFFKEVLNLPAGMESTFGEFFELMSKLVPAEHKLLKHALNNLQSDDLFEANGTLIEDRPAIFAHVEKVVVSLSDAFAMMRIYFDRLDIALAVKKHVLGYRPQFLSFRSEIEEIRSKMGTYPYLTVNYADQDGKYLPFGVIQSKDLQRPFLGTVTLRDFCNRDETKIPPYLEVISVVDHHKSSLKTSSPVKALIADAQSANVLVASLSFHMNDRYSLGGMTAKEIDQQIAEIRTDINEPSELRIFQRLLRRKGVIHHLNAHFIDKKREFIEYLQYLYAIFDDTDLLTKMSQMDVEGVCDLLNRLKSLQLRKEVEVINFDDLERDENFVQTATKRLLQCEDMYSLYAKVYHARERSITAQFELCAKGKESAVFSDTKVQNNCARIGQTKMFPQNVESYGKLASKLQEKWYESSLRYHETNSKVDLYMHMVSTVASADELYHGVERKHDHKDELWLWVPTNDLAIEHLKRFLNAFKTAPQLVIDSLEVEFLGSDGKILSQVFKESFLPIPHTFSNERLPIAILRYKAGSVNSRKSVIAPYLPTLEK